ncbi:transposase [Paenibacillus dokdonensis]|uniref:transposase n=1 Tax=Paenibacillus dokdonensis TaxID=2567944 RepID=UPI003D29CFA3
MKSLNSQTGADNGLEEVLALLFLLIAGFIVVPFIMTALAIRSKLVRYVLHLVALLSFYTAGSIVTTVVYMNRTHETVFTTNVHDVLLNPWFLMTGAYLGLYIPYRLLAGFWVHRHS